MSNVCAIKISRIIFDQTFNEIIIGTLLEERVLSISTALDTGATSVVVGAGVTDLSSTTVPKNRN